MKIFFVKKTDKLFFIYLEKSLWVQLRVITKTVCEKILSPKIELYI